MKKCMEYRVEGRRPVGRPRKTWLESVEVDMAELEIDKEDVHDRRKPSSPLKPKHQKYITSHQCAPIGCTRQEVGSLHSLETTSHSLQQTYLRLLIHTT